jgi:hypothetical protein
MSKILTNIFLEVECGGPSWRCYKTSKFSSHFGHNLLGQSSFIGTIHFDVVECLNSNNKKMSNLFFWYNYIRVPMCHLI